MEPIPVFDIGQVLIRWDPLGALTGQMGSQQAAEDFMAEVDFHAWHRQQDAGGAVADGVETLTARFPHHAVTIARFYDRWLDAVPGEVQGMRDLFLGLTSRMPVYGISNFSRELFDRTLPVYPFLSAFTGLVLSGDEKLTKPDARIYRLLCERYGLPPERCMFIDDSPANVDAARGVGMKAHIFTDAASLVPVLRAEGFAV